MQKNEDILVHLLRLPKSFPFDQIIDAFVNSYPDREYALRLAEHDNDFMWLYFQWWLRKKDCTPFESNRTYVLATVRCDWLDPTLKMRLISELARASLDNFAPRHILMEDLKWYRMAKDAFEGEGALGLRDDAEQRFLVTIAFYIAQIHKFEKVSEAIRQLPPQFLSRLFDVFLDWVAGLPPFVCSTNIAVTFSYLTHVWFIKQIVENASVTVEGLYQKAKAAQPYLSVAGFEPGILILSAHQHLHGEYDYQLAEDAFTAITKVKRGAANAGVLSALARYSMQDFVLKAVTSENSLMIMQAWPLVCKIPFICNSLEFELWFRYSRLFSLAGRPQKAKVILLQLGALASELGQSNIAQLADACSESPNMGSSLSTAIRYIAKERAACPCITRYSPAGFLKFGIEGRSEQAGSQPSLGLLMELFEHLKEAGIDVELCEVAEEELHKLSKNL